MATNKEGIKEALATAEGVVTKQKRAIGKKEGDLHAFVVRSQSTVESKRIAISEDQGKANRRVRRTIGALAASLQEQGVIVPSYLVLKRRSLGNNLEERTCYRPSDNSIILSISDESTNEWREFGKSGEWLDLGTKIVYTLEAAAGVKMHYSEYVGLRKPQ
ncbi:MAG: hypothetical protein ACD_38C00156G0002 [uncultured bacterium]|uniref:Uncharacterized protein n=1 Tax=Candidatus Daviesbacteria bacterium GW2011_GWC2_40_12 TaxID=1618431 RepID=A0A0G0QY78_9BACT|nr:MAG: hypothetical protein ACD_38C00156G0002 [uncultured bacterium]KKQ85518.1 MAG: hypothetical protein UT04_C0003G0023 [Candidatus Daviesbacteria bacterium GW2011_GWF2_38_7]KKR16802.1 MAG: hypothetical protein UT45_C0004G0133 [Candidatus Daviesbacteria bacterium GW2011_GWA2_39_33]KKR24634.1 MAG: hypothetical protein UT54_C0015G0011 [Candidatus Daviesbacteria bacterium GW2011_GWB1_39_5]KKR42416.1 MAG: hypothetical protein UT77_C0002G0069 [Candidatus Daviesbacteria bacterium GW2011_GWC2_40_12]